PHLDRIKYEDHLLNPLDVAKWLGIHPRTLWVWDNEGRGPKVTRVGRYKVRYFVHDILTWLREQPDSLELRRKHRWAARNQRHTTPPTTASVSANQSTAQQEMA